MNKNVIEEYDLKEEGNYFVENQGFGFLAEIREDLETSVEYLAEDTGEARKYLDRGDVLLANIEEFAEGPEDREHLVKSAVDHYRMAAKEAGEDADHFDYVLDASENSILAGIGAEIRADEKEPMSPERADELAEGWRNV